MLCAQNTSRFSLAPITLAVICMSGVIMLGGCKSNSETTEKPANPAKLAELEARQQRAATMRNDAQQSRKEELAARDQAASLERSAIEQRKSAARDEHTAELYRHDAAVLEADGRTVVLAGEHFVEMQDEMRGPRTVIRGEAKLANAQRLRNAASALVAEAKVKRAKADSLDADAGAQLAKADDLQKNFNRLRAALANMPMGTVE